MARYVDGFVLAVPKANLEEYRQMAQRAGEIWKEYGALEYVECVADDVEDGKLTSFPKSVNLQPDETVIFAWIVYPSRAARDAVNDKVMSDPRMKDFEPDKLPFDGMRMFWGGFQSIVEL